MDDVQLETVKRRCDDPKLKIGDVIVVADGVTGVVVARYTPSARKEEVRYIVAVPAQKCRERPR